MSEERIIDTPRDPRLMAPINDHDRVSFGWRIWAMPGFQLLAERLIPQRPRYRVNVCRTTRMAFAVPKANLVGAMYAVQRFSIVSVQLIKRAEYRLFVVVWYLSSGELRLSKGEFHRRVRKLLERVEQRGLPSLVRTYDRDDAWCEIQRTLSAKPTGTLQGGTRPFTYVQRIWRSGPVA